MRFPAKTDLNGLIAALEKAIAEVSPDEIPHHLGNLERLKASLWTRTIASLQEAEGGGLSPRQRRGWQRGLNTLPFATAVVANRTALTAYFAMS